MSVRRKDPDRLRYRFFLRNKWCAPKTFYWEDGECHYSYEAGHAPSRTGIRVLDALDKLWGTSNREPDVVTYMQYMSDKMPDEHYRIVCASLRGLTPVGQVYGDCTWENIVLTNDRVVFIDPGDPRGLFCKELDLAKLLQSERGWELVKKGGEGVQAPWPADNVVALYVTHLYRLLRHPHSEWSLLWAKKEIAYATQYLLH
jgi:hypothetical protein